MFGPQSPEESTRDGQFPDEGGEGGIPGMAPGVETQVGQDVAGLLGPVVEKALQARVGEQQAGEVAPVRGYRFEAAGPTAARGEARARGAASVATDVTILVNNAGSLAFTDPLGGDLAEFEADWRTNYLGTLAMSRAFAPVLERNGGGAIVNVLTLVAYAPRRCGRGSRIRKSWCMGCTPQRWTPT